MSFLSRLLPRSNSDRIEKIKEMNRKTEELEETVRWLLRLSKPDHVNLLMHVDELLESIQEEHILTEDHEKRVTILRSHIKNIVRPYKENQ